MTKEYMCDRCGRYVAVSTVAGEGAFCAGCSEAWRQWFKDNADA